MKKEQSSTQAFAGIYSCIYFKGALKLKRVKKKTVLVLETTLINKTCFYY